MYNILLHIKDNEEILTLFKVLLVSWLEANKIIRTTSLRRRIPGTAAKRPAVSKRCFLAARMWPFLRPASWRIEDLWKWGRVKGQTCSQTKNMGLSWFIIIYAFHIISSYFLWKVTYDLHVNISCTWICPNLFFSSSQTYQTDLQCFCHFGWSRCVCIAFLHVRHSVKSAH